MTFDYWNLINDLIDKHPQKIKDLEEGKVGAFRELIRIAMAESKGSADPKKIEETLYNSYLSMWS